MSHEIYTTDAIIINPVIDGEESISAECLTRELGRIYVHIQGAKKTQNKHRMHVFPFSSVILDCVEGKFFFRCTGIGERNYIYPKLKNLSRYRRELLQQLFHLIQQLVPVHNPIPEIFAWYEFFTEQVYDENLSDTVVYTYFLVAKLRILGNLGYWNSAWDDKVFDQSEKTFSYIAENVKSTERLIDKVMQETQLHF